MTPDDLVVDVVTFDYGMHEENPIDHMSFYSKDQPTRAVKVRKDQVSEMLPHKFKEQSVRVYCKLLDKRSLDSALKWVLTVLPELHLTYCVCIQVLPSLV